MSMTILLLPHCASYGMLWVTSQYTGNKVTKRGEPVTLHRRNFITAGSLVELKNLTKYDEISDARLSSFNRGLISRAFCSIYVSSYNVICIPHM